MLPLLLSALEIVYTCLYQSGRSCICILTAVKVHGVSCKPFVREPFSKLHLHAHGSAPTALRPGRSESEERRAAEEEAAHEDTRRRGLQPTLGQVSSMAAEAQDLPVDQELRARLEGLVAAAEDWEARASGVLNPKKVACCAHVPQKGPMHVALYSHQAVLLA